MREEIFIAASDKRRLTLIKTVKASRRPQRLKATLFLGFFVLAALIFMLSPFFYITQIEIYGINVYSESDIKAAAGLNSASYDSIFFKFASDIEKNIEELPYIKDSQVQKIYPGTLVINITERKTRGYVEYQNMGQYLYIDEDGIVLDVKPFLAETLPVMVGLKFTTFIKGKPLETENTDAFDNVIRLSALFARYNITGVVKVDVSDSMNIKLFINNVTVNLGTIEKADEKIVWTKASLDSLDRNIMGTLFVNDIDQGVYFRLKQ